MAIDGIPITVILFVGLIGVILVLVSLAHVRSPPPPPPPSPLSLFCFVFTLRFVVLLSGKAQLSETSVETMARLGVQFGVFLYFYFPRGGVLPRGNGSRRLH